MASATWEEALAKELKTDQIERFLKRALPEGGQVSLLSRGTQAWSAPAALPAALSYTVTDDTNLQEKISELLKLGVWDFIIDPFLLGWDEATLKRKLSEIKPSEARIWVLAAAADSVAKPVIHAAPVLAMGGHAVHEMAYLLTQIIEHAQKPNVTELAVAVSCDTHFFKSIAKLRAMKALAQAALIELGQTALFENVSWIARSSWREFTAFDAGSNILRNATAVSAGLIGRAHVVESLPYDLLIQTTGVVRERAQRLVLTSQLVLQQEAGLGEMADAASGSFAIEELTRTLGEEAWRLMQQLQANGADKLAILRPSIEEHWAQVQKKFNTRKLVQTGVNDFPEATEEVQLKERFLRPDHQRLGLSFETLRLQAQNLKPRPTVALAVTGNYAALNARLSFAKNFFELLGLEVVESGKGLSPEEITPWAQSTKASIWALVAADADHEGLSVAVPAGVRLYLAGKTTKSGMTNLYAGMDVRAALAELLAWGGAR